MGIKDSLELALQDWLGTRAVRPRRRTTGRGAGPRPTSTSPPARSAPGCTSRACRLFPVVGWAERGGCGADGHGNSVPRFHITWGTGPGSSSRSSAGCARRVEQRAWSTLAVPPPGRRADRRAAARSIGVRGTVLAPDSGARGRAEPTATRSATSSSRAQAVIVTSRRHRRQPRPGPAELAATGSATPPEHMISGVPAHVDGRMLGITEAAGRQHHQPRPDVALRRGHPATGTRSGPTTASGSCPARRRCGSTRTGQPAAGAAASPASTRSARSSTSCATGHDYSWFVLTQKIIEKEFALSGSEQNPDLTGKDVAPAARDARRARRARPRSRRSRSTAPTSSSRDDLRELVAGMNAAHRRAAARPRRSCEREVDRARPRDRQRLHQGRPGRPRSAARARYRGDQLIRVAAPHRLLDPDDRAADRRAAEHPHPQDARRPRDRPRRAGAARRRRAAARPVRRRRGGRLRRRRRCTATARSRARSSAAASSPAAPPAARPPRRSADQRPTLQRARNAHSFTIDVIRIVASRRPRGTLKAVIEVRSWPRTRRPGIVRRSGVLCVPGAAVGLARHSRGTAPIESGTGRPRGSGCGAGQPRSAHWSPAMWKASGTG